MRVITLPHAIRMLVLMKSRQLVAFDDDVRYAHPPFPYDKYFFKELRKDQVPRFLRCMSSQWKLPVQFMKLDKLVAVQNRVKVEIIDHIRLNPNPDLPVVVRIAEAGPDYIVDGLHRLTVDWLEHRELVPVRYANLSDKTIDVEPILEPGKFKLAEHNYGYAS